MSRVADLVADLLATLNGLDVGLGDAFEAWVKTQLSSVEELHGSDLDIVKECLESDFLADRALSLPKKARAIGAIATFVQPRQRDALRALLCQRRLRDAPAAREEPPPAKRQKQEQLPQPKREPPNTIYMPEAEPPAPVGWGVVGCGAVAHRFARSLQHVPGAFLAAAWSRRPASVAAFAAEHGGGVVAAASFEEMLNVEGVAAVYVATLPDSHAAYSMAALRAGKAVLCEKPSAPSGDELEQVLAVARAERVLWMEAMKVPFYPLYKELARRLRGGDIGRVRFVRAGSSLTGVDPDHPSFRPDLAGGALLSIGVYGAFLATDWLGPAAAVDAAGRVGPSGVDVFAAVQTTHRLPGEAGDAQAQTYCGLDLLGPGEAVLAATGGYARIHEPWWNPTRATIQPADGAPAVELELPSQHGGLYHEIVHFCDLVRAGCLESDVVSHRRSLEIMEVLDGAKASAFKRERS